MTTLIRHKLCVHIKKKKVISNDCNSQCYNIWYKVMMIASDSENRISEQYGEHHCIRSKQHIQTEVFFKTKLVFASQDFLVQLLN